jgi:hypothetical protein
MDKSSRVKALFAEVQPIGIVTASAAAAAGELSLSPGHFCEQFFHMETKS